MRKTEEIKGGRNEQKRKKTSYDHDWRDAWDCDHSFRSEDSKKR